MTATEVIQIFCAIGGPAAVAWLTHRLVVLPQQQAADREAKLGRELEWYKDRFKDTAHAKAEHVAAVETAELGAPSRPPTARAKLDTLTAIQVDAHYAAWDAAQRVPQVMALAPPMAAPRRPPPPPVRVVEVDARKVGARPTLPAPPRPR